MKLNKPKLFVFITILLAILLVCTTVDISAFDKKATLPDEFTQEYIDLSDRVVTVRTFGTGYGVMLNTETSPPRYEIREGVFGMEGSGFVRDLPFHKFIITNNHVISPSRVSIPLSKNASWETKIIYIKNISIFIVGCTSAIGGNILYTDPESDIAVLYIDRSSPFQDTGIPLTFSHWYELHESYLVESPNVLSDGDAVGVVVRKRDEDGRKTSWYEVRIGKIVSTGVKLPGVVDISALTWFQPMDFTVDLTIYPGDSGSPVVVWLKGKPFIIGVARAVAWCGTTGERFSYATRLDLVVHFLQGYSMVTIP